ncbi:hypothetical protein [Enterococcus sp. AZ109]|uniref:hypothetical protein n=1 Tax=Enterococcus sp. AZ109 TaxID=2774634 RepID=UPI003F1FE544
MSRQPFTDYQIFNLTRETLEQRIGEYYDETQDGATTIKLLLALRVRYQLGAEEFALVLQDLVKYLFTKTKATRTMKRFFYYFAEYFDTAEWKKLCLRVFPIRNFIEKAKSIAGSLIAQFRPSETAVP